MPYALSTLKEKTPTLAEILCRIFLDLQYVDGERSRESLPLSEA